MDLTWRFEQKLAACVMISTMTGLNERMLRREHEVVCAEFRTYESATHQSLEELFEIWIPHVLRSLQQFYYIVHPTKLLLPLIIPYFYRIQKKIT